MKNEPQTQKTQHFGWLLVVVGPLVAGIGVVWLGAPLIPWPGELPGDMSAERENSRFYFPLTTWILINVVLTGIMWLIRFFSEWQRDSR